MDTKNFQEAWLLKIGVLRVTSSQEFLDLFTSDQDKFVRHIVTGDESWIHHWDPESKQVSMQWRHASFLPLRKFKTQPWAGKIMATIFWDSKGVLLIDYLPDKTAINGHYYANLLLKLARQSRINDAECKRAESGCCITILQSTSQHRPASSLRLSLCTAISLCIQF